MLQQLLDMGVISTLPEELQWNIRMLLPRQPPAAPTGPAPAPSAQPSGTLTAAVAGGAGAGAAATRPASTSVPPATLAPNDYMQYLLQNPQLLQLAAQQLGPAPAVNYLPHHLHAPGHTCQGTAETSESWFVIRLEWRVVCYISSTAQMLFVT